MMVRNVWSAWCVCSVEKPAVQGAVMFVKEPSEGRRYYEVFVYLPRSITRKEASELFSRCFRVEHASGKVLRLKQALLIFGPEGQYHDVFDYIDSS